MAMTMTQKILAAHAGLSSVSAGQLIEVNLDLVMGNDVPSPVAIHEMESKGFQNVFDNNRIALVMDHFTPNKDIKSAENCKQVRTFAKEYGIKNFFDVGKMGIEHALLPEKGLVISGDTVIGADSHTCTYGALGAFSTGVGSTDMAAGMISGKAWFKVPSALEIVITGKFQKYVSGKDVILHLIGKIGVDGARYRSLEFTGDGIQNLSMDDRFCIANMAIECGAKNGIFPVDEKTLAYMAGRTDRKPVIFEADADAEYDEVIEINLDELKPTVSFPHLPENTHTDGVRCIVIPATQTVYMQCIEEGLTKIFVEAGAIVSTPTCGPCLGGHMGILAAGERAVSTTNRNFVGRMGHPTSEVYLASPYVAAASAVTGKISCPCELD